jgi:hypothetical protein
MTTAYTSLLGLALPVTGELSGTWGDTVNNSITSLLDSAIAGTTTLSSDTDVTLSTTTGASNTSREAILLWTAGGTVTRTITAPAQSKIYTVINASSSTQSIKVVGAGPTTGVTIVKGEAAVIAWNGSDFVKVSNTGGSFTTQDLTVTGNTILGDAITDTTTLNAQTRFYSLATLGYANMTGPAATSLSTTAPAFLYSGATTYTVADVSGGTKTHAPIISLGQTSITNATTATTFTNASTLYIGGTPNASTNITFTRPYALYLDSGTTTASAAVTYTNAATLYIAGAPTAGSNVTLTTPYALYVNAGASYLGGNTAITGTLSATGDSAFGASSTAGFRLYAKGASATSSDFALVIQNSTPTSLLTVRNDGQLGFGVSATAMILDTSGNLGIGTTSTTNYILRVNAASPLFGMMVSGTQAFTIGALSGGGGAFYYGAGNLEAMRLDASGNLGLGVTPSAWNTAGGAALQVKNASLISYANADLELSFNSYYDGATYKYIANGFATRYDQINGTHVWYKAPSNSSGAGAVTPFTQAMTLDASGNLGLGVTPSVWDTVSAKAIQLGGGSLWGYTNTLIGLEQNSYYNASGGYTYIASAKATDYYQYDGQHVWRTAPSGTAGNAITFTQAMTLDASGNLLVGVTSGSARLNVGGSAPYMYVTDTAGANKATFVAESTNTLVNVGSSYLGTSAVPLALIVGGAEKARITTAGYVETKSKLSIGTSATAGVFHYVVGTNNSDIVAYWANQLSTLMYTGLGNVTYASGENAADAALYVRKGPTTSRSINAAGTINAAGLDYAEYMEKSGDFTIAKGDICGIDVNGKLTNVFADAVLFMVKSTNPSYVGGDVWGNEEALGLTKPKQPEDDATDDEKAQYATNKTAFDAALEVARQKIDRISFCGQVPVNVIGATAGQYIIPVNNNGAIKGEAVSNPTFEQYQSAVGKVIAIESDGRAKIIVKVA